MRAMALIVVALLLPVSPAWAQADELTVYASVVDKNDAPVAGLSASDFVVRENDVSREVLRASQATAPLQIALLVDTSQAIDDHLLDIRNALQAFFKQMGGKHEIALIGFGERPTTLVDLTRDAARLQKGIGTVYARQGSGTYLLDAIVETADAFERRKAARPHIIVFAARGPEFSERHHQTVGNRIEQPRRTGTAAGGRRRDAHERRPPGRSADVDGSDGAPAVGRQRAGTSISGDLRAAPHAHPSQDAGGQRQEAGCHGASAALASANARIAASAPVTASAV